MAKNLIDIFFREAVGLVNRAKQLGEEAEEEVDHAKQEELLKKFADELKDAQKKLAWAIQSQTDQKIQSMLRVSISDLAARAADLTLIPGF